MNAEPLILQPVRGPIGFRQLFFTSRSVPMLKLLPRRGWGGTVALIGALLVGVLFWLLMRSLRPNDAEHVLWFMSAWGWILAEGVMATLGGRLAVSELRRWQRLQRFSEIYLSLLRPLTIGQLILGPPLRILLLFLAGCYVTFAFCLLWHHPNLASLLIPYALIVLNAAATLHFGAWAQLTILLGLNSPIKTFVAMSNLSAVYLLICLPFALLIVLLGAFSYSFFEGHPEALYTTFLLTLPLVSILLITVKMLFARAFAVRLEQSVFPQMTFDGGDTGRITA